MAGEAITDYSNLINLATSSTAEVVNFYKSARVAGAAPGTLVAGRWVSLWQYDGCPGAAASAAPGASAATTNATAGAMAQASPAASAKKRLVSFTLSSLVVGTYVIADRYNQQGNLSGTVITAQTVNSPALPSRAPSDGKGVEAAAEIYTQIGATTTTIKLSSYTDDAGNTAQVGPLVVFGNTGFREAQRLVPLPVLSGDKGLRAIASVQVTATTGTAGAFGPTMFKRIATLPLSTIGAGEQWNCMLKAGGPVDLGTNSDACLFMMLYPNTTTAPECYGQALFVEK